MKSLNKVLVIALLSFATTGLQADSPVKTSTEPGMMSAVTSLPSDLYDAASGVVGGVWNAGSSAVSYTWNAGASACNWMMSHKLATAAVAAAAYLAYTQYFADEEAELAA